MEEIKMLKEIRERLENLEVSNEEIERAESILKKYSGINREFAANLYNNNNFRRKLKAKNLWDSKTTGINFNERYLGKAECKVAKQNLWSKGNKTRIYFDILVDDEFLSTGHYIEINKN
jgi:hypothetical protein